MPGWGGARLGNPASGRVLCRVGVAVCRHMRRLERVVLGYLEVPDPPEETSRLKVLQALQNTVRAAWPR